MEHTRLPEEASSEDSTLVQQVSHWISILDQEEGETRDYHGSYCNIYKERSETQGFVNTISQNQIRHMLNLELHLKPTSQPTNSI